MSFERTFRPAVFARGAHRQTIWANYAPRRSIATALSHDVDAVLLDTHDGDRPGCIGTARRRLLAPFCWFCTA